MSALISLLPYVAILAIFWLVLVRPQQRRAREVRSMQRALAVGDEVVLTSGVFGTVQHLDDDVARVEIAPGTTIKVARAAIGGVVGDTEPDPAPEQPAGPEEY